MSDGNTFNPDINSAPPAYDSVDAPPSQNDDSPPQYEASGQTAADKEPQPMQQRPVVDQQAPALPAPTAQAPSAPQTQPTQQQVVYQQPVQQAGTQIVYQQPPPQAGQQGGTQVVYQQHPTTPPIQQGGTQIVYQQPPPQAGQQVVYQQQPVQVVNGNYPTEGGPQPQIVYVVQQPVAGGVPVSQQPGTGGVPVGAPPVNVNYKGNQVTSMTNAPQRRSGPCDDFCWNLRMAILLWLTLLCCIIGYVVLIWYCFYAPQHRKPNCNQKKGFEEWVAWIAFTIIGTCWVCIPYKSVNIGYFRNYQRLLSFMYSVYAATIFSDDSVDNGFMITKLRDEGTDVL